MKSYIINRQGIGCVIITNGDAEEERIIKSIRCNNYQNEYGEKYSLEIVLNDKHTLKHEISGRFMKINPGSFGFINEIVEYQSDLNLITKYFKIIQEYDPLPLYAFLELHAYLPVYCFAHCELIDYEQALLNLENESNLELNNEILLAEIKVLQRVPITNFYFKEANELIFHLLQGIHKELMSDDEKRDILEQKFSAAAHAKLPEAAYFFDELSGSNGLTPKFDEITVDTTTLIKMSEKFKEMQARINSLEQALRDKNPLNLSSYSFFEEKTEKMSDKFDHLVKDTSPNQHGG